MNLWCYFYIGIFLTSLQCILAKEAQKIDGSKLGQKIDAKLLLLTVATEETDGFLRYLKSAKHYGLDLEVLGKGHQWKGGNVKKYPGGGQKIHLLREKLESLQAQSPDLLVLFTDGYDIIINGDSTQIIERYLKSGADILFSAEEYCWPDQSLKLQYPIVKSGKRYLNSGMFMGKAADLFKLVSFNVKISDREDDQLYYTNIYLQEELRKNFGIKLDHTSTLFQNLNGVTDSVELNFENSYKGGHVGLKNLAYSTEPLIVHGNGNSKIFLNYLGNYIGGSWNAEMKCVECVDTREVFSSMQDDDLPTITLALFVERPTPFLDGFFEKISELHYPKSKIHLFIHNNESYHQETVDHFLSTHKKNWASESIFGPDEILNERDARNKAIDRAIDTTSEFFFAVDSDVRITERSIITKLMDKNKAIVAPMIRRAGKLYSNFWGALSEDGFYARSDDYMEIVDGEKKGIWNVPYISSTYLIDTSRLKSLKNAYSFENQFDPDMSFTRHCLDQGYFMHVDNLESYGYLIISDEYDVSLKHPDFYQLFDNRLDWEKRYLHENYTKVLESDQVLIQHCPDVYWFPVFSTEFCHDLIDIMENNGKWSSGSNKDERLAGGYENVPTRDIHMNQVGLERHWLHMLDQYFRPVQEKVFVGYYHVPPRAIMNFVVRYRPDEQPSLKPHHDASTYSVNLALNQHGVDYEGGGSNFLRYNCSLVESRLGWALVHPGRLTHYHEGLPTTEGTRYIMVSFVDP